MTKVMLFVLLTLFAYGYAVLSYRLAKRALCLHQERDLAASVTFFLWPFFCFAHSLDEFDEIWPKLGLEGDVLFPKLGFSFSLGEYAIFMGATLPLRAAWFLVVIFLFFFSILLNRAINVFWFLLFKILRGIRWSVVRPFGKA
ncbi:MAG: hypothetical protein AAB495_01370 [Patescibacteria group bacterium]